ncbi:serine protease inhibitor dipetalogastin-like [Topomyia yanbarensis]|uniref:serine protease inhibitor dipetalogastin-like n=1 Tax=Topomyia yanbarensis TaxID=2498891 RepID=UPI00273C4A12|nr:serine protease inhibitor dipetalogastin-like [Topomyia yanbarensis]
MHLFQLLAIAVFLALVGLSRATYTVYPPEYDLTDEQVKTFIGCIAQTMDEKDPKSRYDPVCATDGFSYYNQYLLGCLTELVPSVQFSFFGRCPNEPIFRPMESIRDWWLMPEGNRRKSQSCMSQCEKLFKPVCGTDKKSYSSDCVLGCVTEIAPHITKSYEGFCTQDMVVQQKCPPILQPFCGTDGVTYLNLCHLRYAAAMLPGLKEAHLGDCVRRLDVIQKGFDLQTNLKSEKHG